MHDDDQTLTLSSVAPDTRGGRRATASHDSALSDSVQTPGGTDIDALIEPLLRDALCELDGRAPALAGMTRYHLGYVDAGMNDLPAGAVDRGKRVRPAVALLVPHLGAYVGLLAQYYRTPGFRTVDPSGATRDFSWSVQVAPSAGDGFSTAVTAGDVPRLLQFSGYLRDFLAAGKP